MPAKTLRDPGPQRNPQHIRNFQPAATSSASRFSVSPTQAIFIFIDAARAEDVPSFFAVRRNGHARLR